MAGSQQLALQFRGRGGARRGAGRPAKGKRAGVSHQRRPAVSRHHPLHVTLRARAGLPSLREPAVFQVVRRALAAGKARAGFGLVHFSVQPNHVHLLIEAQDRAALSRGVQGLCVRVARALNRQLSRRGRVFADRYHDRALKTPRIARLALRYILLNARKHQHAAVPSGFVDPCSSAPWFDGFARPAALAFGAQRARAEWSHESPAPPVVAPRCWLLRIGVQRAGPFDIDETPSAR